jgi:hypothetical protein
MKSCYQFLLSLLACVSATKITTRVLANSGWIQLGSDINGEAAADQSGSSVSLSADGSRVAIGAPYNGGTANFAGHVRVFELRSDTWFQLGSDIDGEAGADTSGLGGSSVSLSADGSRVAIGARSNDGNGLNAGHVRVFEFRSDTWFQLGSDINGEAANDASGWSVSLSADGSRVAIGATNNDGTGSNAGHVRVFEFRSDTWFQLGSDINGEAANDAMGSSVSLSADGSRVAVGARLNDGTGVDAGHVRVFEFRSDTWFQLGSDINGEAANDASAESVSLSADGSRVAIGARFNDGTGANAGHVRVFEFRSDTWFQLGSDIDGEAAEDRSGSSVSLSADGSRVAIGAANNDGTAGEAGHVRVFEFRSDTWFQLGSDINGEALNDLSGLPASLSADGSRVAIGAANNDGSGANAGHVRVYQLTEFSMAPTFSPSELPTTEPSTAPTFSPSELPTSEPSTAPTFAPSFRCPIYLPGGITLPGCQLFNARSSSICYPGPSGLLLVNKGNPVSSCFSLAGTSCGTNVIELEDTSLTGCEWSSDQFWEITTTSHTLSCAPLDHPFAYPYFQGTRIGVPSTSAFCSQLRSVCNGGQQTVVALMPRALTEVTNKTETGTKKFLRRVT